MSENTNTFITGEVYPYQITDRTLSFIPKLSPAADDHFKELVTGKIKISLYDFSNGKGDNGIYENHKEGTCVSFNSVLNYWIHYYIDHTNCSRPVYIMALIRRNYYVTKKLERCYINLR